jgi:hypothetical protein
MRPGEMLAPGQAITVSPPVAHAHPTQATSPFAAIAT